VTRIVKDGAKAPDKVPNKVIDGAVFDARNEASRIVTEAHAEAERIREQARAEGRAEGRAEIAAMIARARRDIDRRVAAAELELRALAVRIAERILRRQLSLEPERVVDIARGALEDARSRHEMVLRVHPDDVSAIERDKPGLLARLSVSAHVLVRADDAIERGGCIVETDVGTVDARLATQLAALRKVLEESGS
jgi:flagellar biosynthesis/type III secretory pathway protein FliH